MTTDKLIGIEACVFDAYGTLFDVASSARHCADEIGPDWQNFSGLWRQKQLEYTWLRSLMGSFQDFWQVTGDALDFAMETHQLDSPELRSQLMELYLKLDPYPEIKNVLSSLKDNGLQTAILSNGSKTMLTAAVRHAELDDLLDGVYSVDDVGVFKVDPRTYQMAVDHLGTAASNIAFFSSNAWDAAGAAHFGFKVFWVNRFGQKPEKLGVKPDVEVPSLSNILDMIEL